jgi:internalin A
MRNTGAEPVRHRLTLSLRIFMVLVLVVGGWLGWRVRRASFQRRAVAAIRESGGWVWYDYQLVHLPGGQDRFLRNAKPWAPGWLRRSIGDEYFQEVVRVALLYRGDPDQNRPVPFNELLGLVAGLDRVAFLSLNEIPTTDDGLAQIGRTAGLEELTIGLSPLQDSKLTAGGLAHLRALTKLRGLSISGLSLAEGVPVPWIFLARLTRLESLSILESGVDCGVLAQLEGLTRLQSLSLPDIRPEDADLVHLAGLSQLEGIALSGERGISDDGLANLAGLKSLKGLSLPGASQVTDAGLAHIRGLTRLRTLDLKGSSVTDAGLAHLAGLVELEDLSVGVSWSGSEACRFAIGDAGLAHLRGMIGLRDEWHELKAQYVTAK